MCVRIAMHTVTHRVQQRLSVVTVEGMAFDLTGPPALLPLRSVVGAAGSVAQSAVFLAAPTCSTLSRVPPLTALAARAAARQMDALLVDSAAAPALDEWLAVLPRELVTMLAVECAVGDLQRASVQLARAAAGGPLAVLTIGDGRGVARVGELLAAAGPDVRQLHVGHRAVTDLQPAPTLQLATFVNVDMNQWASDAVMAAGSPAVVFPALQTVSLRHCIRVHPALLELLARSPSLQQLVIMDCQVAGEITASLCHTLCTAMESGLTVQSFLTSTPIFLKTVAERAAAQRLHALAQPVRRATPVVRALPAVSRAAVGAPVVLHRITVSPLGLAPAPLVRALPVVRSRPTMGVQRGSVAARPRAVSLT
jgi:hypothetical protein